MNDVTTTASTTTSTTAAGRTPGAALGEALAAYGPDSLTSTAPVTGGRGVEVDDVIELLAELKFLQDLDRLF